MKSYRIGKVHARLILVFTALLILMLGTTSAQAPSPQTAPPTTTIKVSTRLVTVDVVAQDNKGRPIQGLTKNDFELWEDGKAQEISVFSVEGNLVQPAPGPSPVVPLPPNTFTNRPARPSDAPATATVILLDGLNTQVEDLAMARVQVAKFIRQMGPQDRVALLILGTELRVVQDFTSDPALLLNALEGTHPKRQAAGGAQAPKSAKASAGALIPEPPAVAPPPPGHFFHFSTPDAGKNAHAHDAADETWRTFEAIGEHLAQMPGRKTLIWISYGSRLVIKDLAPDDRLVANETVYIPQIRRVSRLLGKYNVAVYPIDARGVVSLRRGFNAKGSSLLLADLTGGRAVYGDNDIALAMRSAIDDAKLTYVLGYYPAAKKWDSKFHTLKVQVNQPGVKLLYRSGYLAVSEQNQPPDDQQRMVGEALQSPLDFTAIGLSAKLQKEAANGGQQLTLNLRVDINDLPLSHDHNLWQGELEVVIAQQGPGGDVASEGARKHSVKLNLKEDYYTQLKAEGLSLSFPFALNPHAVELKVVVHDINSGTMGSVGIPLDKTAGE